MNYIANLYGITIFAIIPFNGKLNWTPILCFVWKFHGQGLIGMFCVVPIEGLPRASLYKIFNRFISLLFIVLNLVPLGIKQLTNPFRFSLLHDPRMRKQMPESVFVRLYRCGKTWAYRQIVTFMPESQNMQFSYARKYC